MLNSAVTKVVQKSFKINYAEDQLTFMLRIISKLFGGSQKFLQKYIPFELSSPTLRVYRSRHEIHTQSTPS